MRIITAVLFFITLSASAQYEPGTNLIIIGHDGKNVLKEIKLILAQSDYSIRYYDPEIGLIETDYKAHNNVRTRLVMIISDSTVQFKGFSMPGTNVAVRSGMFEMSGASEYKNEFREGKSTVMAKGFDEMEMIATKLHDKYLKHFEVRTE